LRDARNVQEERAVTKGAAAAGRRPREGVDYGRDVLLPQQPNSPPLGFQSFRYNACARPARTRRIKREGCRAMTVAGCNAGCNLAS
jgi:hypothetical protein